MISLEQALSRYPGAQTFRYGDSATLNAEVLALVRSGAKTVTCDATAAFSARGEPVPEVGRVDIALDWQGAPALAQRTLEVFTVPFDAMTEAFVAPMGEFRDLAHWRDGYEAYLRRSGHFAPDVEMLVERFELVEDFGAVPPEEMKVENGRDRDV